MIPDDNEPKPINPRFAAGGFFALFGLFFLVFAKYTLLSIEANLRLPIFPAVLIVFITGAYTGAFFGEALAKSRTWYHSFLIGVLMAILSILFVSFSAMVRAWLFDTGAFANAHGWRDYVVYYGVLVMSIALIVGVWLVLLTGLAAIWFNKHFLPGLLAADQQRLQAQKRQHDKTDD